MVWLIDNYKSCHHMTGPHFGFKVNDDRFFQTGNIMLDLCKLYDAYEIKKLILMGVNIFNVDLTLHNEGFLQGIESAIVDVEDDISMHPKRYRMPISLSVLMSVRNPKTTITKRADFIILKDVTVSKQVTELRQLSPEYESIPILLWIGILKTEATNELIKISNGIILEVENGIINQLYHNFIQECFKACKPVFYSNPDIIKEYYEGTANDRKLMIFTEQLVSNRFHGVYLKAGEQDSVPTELLLSMVKAFHIAELKVDVAKDYYNKSFDLKVPALPPTTVAYAASLAAIHCGASIIIVLTTSGQSAKTISFASPPCHVLAITIRKNIARRLHLYRRVIPLVYDRAREHSWRDECRNRVGFGTAFALSARLLYAGAKLVVLAPTEESSGFCDSFQIVSLPLPCDE